LEAKFEIFRHAFERTGGCTAREKLAQTGKAEQDKKHPALIISSICSRTSSCSKSSEGEWDMSKVSTHLPALSKGTGSTSRKKWREKV